MLESATLKYQVSSTLTSCQPVWRGNCDLPGILLLNVFVRLRTYELEIDTEPTKAGRRLPSCHAVV